MRLSAFPKSMVPQQWAPLVWGSVSSLAILGLGLLFLRKEGRHPQDAGLVPDRTSGLRLLGGVVIGLSFYGLQLAAIRAIAGPVHPVLKEGADFSTFALAVGGTFALACMEELGFRGYPLRTLLLHLKLWPAQLVVAVAFGLSHLAFGWSWPSILLGVIPSGLIFGFATTASRGLAMPIGIHAGVNLAQSSLHGSSAWGFWTLEMDEQVRERIAAIGPVSGAAVALLVALAFWGLPALLRSAFGRLSDSSSNS